MKIQALWRAYRARKAYREMTAGYGRLQALWRARRLAFRYSFARKRITGFQAGVSPIIRSCGSLELDNSYPIFLMGGSNLVKFWVHNMGS